MSVERTRLIEQVREGMHVVDLNGDKLGDVEYVQMGDEGAITTQGTNQDSPQEQMPKAAIGGVTETLHDSEPDVPDTKRRQLLRSGFIKVDRSWGHAARYVEPDQIAEVTGDTVRLSIAQDELPRD